METLSPGSGYSRVVFMKGAQLGGTECGNNLIGYHIHQDPVPIMMVQPSLTDAKKVSQQRIAPMIDATPVLRERIADPKARDSGNTVLLKLFPGGLLLMTGANSDKGLRSTPASVLFADEIDAYPEDVAGQGDPVALAEKRTTTFPNRKIFLVSTPTIKDMSRIEREFLKSDRRYYHVPCPHCAHRQRLRWAGLEWDHDSKGKSLPDTVRYVCEMCGKHIDEFTHKTAMLENATPELPDGAMWVKDNPGATVAGFHLNALYSPIGLGLPWSELVEQFLEAKQDPALLKTYVNTVLGEVWEDEASSFEEGELESRREDYGGEIPMGVGVLTAGIDTQDNRVEIELVGWGKGQESWSIEWKQFYGRPADPAFWVAVDEYLKKRRVHASGATLPVAAACVDSGGHHTDAVYKFCKWKLKRRIYAIKGSSAAAQPLTTPAVKSKKGEVHPVMVGADTAKDAIYARLTIVDKGPGYCHFPLEAPEEYFRQLTAEVVETRYFKGHPTRRYIKAKHARNEVLDCRVYAYAALDLLNANLDKCVNRLIRHSEKTTAASAETPIDTAMRTKKDSPSRKRISRRRTGWMSGL